MAVMKFGGYVLSRLFRKPATQLYPIVKKEYFERTRGHVAIEVDKCIFCGICVRKCPTGAITVVKQDKSWGIERLQCIQCSSCVDNCPKKCLSMGNTYTEPSTGSVKDVFNARVPDNQENS